MNVRNTLGSVTALRTMAIAVCVITNLYFLSIFVYLPSGGDAQGTLEAVRFWAATVMVLLFLALRFAMKSLTAPKDEELDELQLKLRDDAYRLGYLVVRRVGLGALIAAAVLVPISIRIYYNNYSRFDLVPPKHQDFVYFFRLWFEPWNIMHFALALIFVLTFTAYCFPIVVLAWRDANYRSELSLAERNEAASAATSKNSQPIIAMKARAEIESHVLWYRRRLQIVGWAWLASPFYVVLAMSMQSTPFVNFFFITGYLLGAALLAFSVWVMATSLFKQKRLVELANSLAAENTAIWRRTQTLRYLTLATGISAAALPLLLLVSGAFQFGFIGVSNVMVIGGVLQVTQPLTSIAMTLVIICQPSAFTIARRLAKTIANLDDAAV